jgi:lipid-A-disaccharide synthase-like uncharacterized protein
MEKLMTPDHIWIAVGFAGQALFASRFLVQLLRSEMEGRSVIPVAFWYFSIGGGLITLVYSFHLGKVGLPFLMAQLGGLVVYARNLWLVHREKKRAEATT